MSLTHVPTFRVAERAGGRITLDSAEGHCAHIFVLEPDLVRVLVLPGGALRFPQTWAIAPGREDVPPEGRNRFDLTGFSTPDFQLTENADGLEVVTAQVRLTIRLPGFHCRWQVRLGDGWRDAAADRATQAYNFGYWDRRAYHYLRREPHEMYFGLGERAGSTNRAGQSYRMANLDAMGYNARTTDPLYKHIPFYLTWKPAARLGFGLFYDTVSECTFDLGRELDNYHGHYRYFVADHGDVDYYFIAGRSLGEVVQRFTWLTGRPVFSPKWGLGYSGSTMAYTDAPNAQEQMEGFLDNCARHDILCDSFHLSSGYTSIGDKRYVFNWNRDKFPDPKRFVQSYLDRGVRLCPNIKPCLLRDHPRFADVEAKGLLIRNPDGTPHLVQYWDELGAYLDFTNPEAVAWWKGGVTGSLLEYGITSTWNDNNEFEIADPEAFVHGFGTRRAAVEVKPLLALLMMRASRDAQREFAPGLRPFLISRSGTVGMHRYVQTWSGDNYTSWETLRFNLKMGIGLALSGVSNLGHDIGGFSGPKPDPELFVRWVQFGILLPRFSIHSWNDDQSANEPWMHPEVTPYISDLIKFRYRLMPYLYDLLWRYHRDYKPVIRPTFLDFPHDPRCFEENDDWMLGANLLAAPVVEPGQRARPVYLPAGSGWYDFFTGDYFAGGHTVTLPAPWDRPGLLAKEGCAIPLNLADQHFAKPRDQRGFSLFPPRGAGAFIAGCFEDDGESERYREGGHWSWQLKVQTTSEAISVEVSRSGEGFPPHDRLELLLPRFETRTLRVAGGTIRDDRAAGFYRVLEVGIGDRL